MSLTRAVPLAVAALAFALLAARFDWVCDDAYITFRYARNLAEGHGLVYNAGEAIEGYSNFLWTLWLALFELAGVEITFAARASSFLCGLGMLAVLARFLHRRLEFDALRSTPVLLFAATLPPLAVWATGGLAAMPQAFFLVLTFERLFGDRERPRGVQAGLAAAAAALMRADGPLLVGLLLASSMGVGLRQRALLRAAATAAAISATAALLHIAWRYGYYGELAPNTARAKVNPGWVAFERGLKYVGTLLICVPSITLALVAALALARKRWALVPGTLVAGTLAYAIFVGGDFMAMGRFLVPALPFVALLLALALARLPAIGASLAAVALVSLSVAAAFDVHFVPSAWRERLFFRWSASGQRTEVEQWEFMREQSRRWTSLGRALAAHTSPGESLIHGTIGAVGYHSRLTILDPFGLVNREEFRDEADASARHSPGHHRRVPLPTFVAMNPTYLDAELVPAASPRDGWPRWLRPGTENGDRAELELLPIDGVEQAPPDHVLRLLRNRQP